MSKDFDVSEQVQSDIERVQRLNKVEIRDIPPGAIIEFVLWALAGVSVVAMIVSMPWVGEDKVVPGEVWLGYSLAAILLFGALAFALRWLRDSAGDIDAGMDARFDTSRRR